MIDYKKNMPSFVEGEKEYPLIQLCSIYTRSSDYYKQSEIVGDHEGAIILQPSNIENNQLVFEDLRYYSWEGYYERPRDAVEVDNIVMSKYAAPASPYKSAVVSYLPEPAIANPSLLLFKEIKCNPYYLQLVISSPIFQNKLKQIQSKTTLPNVSIKNVYALTIPLPSDSRQQELVDMLSKYRTASDQLISSLNAEIRLRQQQMEFIMNQKLWEKDYET